MRTDGYADDCFIIKNLRIRELFWLVNELTRIERRFLLRKKKSLKIWSSGIYGAEVAMILMTLTTSLILNVPSELKDA